VILLAIPSKVILELINTLPNLSGKVLFDCSNPASPANHENDRPDISIAEEIAKSASGAHVAKIFNTAGFEVLGNPDFNGTKASMFYSSNDDKASEAAQLLASDAGFDPIHAGALSVSPMLEELTRFWGALAYGQGMGRQIAFKLLTR
jgi:predicted dinucleotide-binding enzyme